MPCPRKPIRKKYPPARAGTLDAAAPKQRQKTYPQIVAALPPPAETGNTITDMAKNGDLQQLKAWSKRNTEEQEVLDDLLSCAAEYGHLDMVRYLVDLGANVHAWNEHALERAAGKGHMDVVRYLVEEHHAMDNYAFACAVRHQHLDVARYMLDHGAQKSILSEEKRTSWTHISPIAPHGKK